MDKIVFRTESIRKRFNYNNYSPINILDLAMRILENLTIVWMPMLEDVSGCCYKLSKDNLILINSNHIKGRQNFTLAHELYHLLYDYGGAIVCTYKNNDKEFEKKADEFANSLLMPNSALYMYIEDNQIEKWNLKDIIKCEQYFQISHVAFLKRLKKENFISNEEYADFKKDIITNSKKLGFSSDLYLPSSEDEKYYALGALVPLVGEVFEMGKISKKKRDEILLDAYRGNLIFNLTQEGDNFE